MAVAAVPVRPACKEAVELDWGRSTDSTGCTAVAAGIRTFVRRASVGRLFGGSVLGRFGIAVSVPVPTTVVL